MDAHTVLAALKAPFTKKLGRLYLASALVLLAALAAVWWAVDGYTFRNVVSFVGVSIVYAVLILYILAAFLSYIDDLAFPGLNFKAQLAAGNTAVGVFLAGTCAALILGMCLLAAKASAAPLDRYDDAFQLHGRAAFGYTVDWRYFKAQGMTESNLYPDVCSAVGACGVMQFMPGTAVGMGLQDRFDARQSIRAGIWYDRELWGKFKAPRPPLDRLGFALSSYNCGLGNVLKFQRAATAAGGGDPNLWATVAPFAWKEPREYVERIHRWQAKFSRRS